MHSAVRIGRKNMATILMVVGTVMKTMVSLIQKGRKKRKQGQMCRCGATSHLRTNHSECRLNKKIMKSGVFDEDRASENSDVIHYSGDAMSDAESSSCESHVSNPDYHEWCFEDNNLW